MKIKRYGVRTQMAVLLLLSSFVSGCVGVVAVGAAGSMVVYDRRSFSMIEQDARIFYVINRALSNDRRFRYSHIRVTSFNHVVLLSGQATSEDFKAEAAKVAQSTPNVRRVYNELVIGEPSSIADRSRDAFITSKVRTQLLTQKGLESGSIHIVTENSTVFLMGIATHEQADLAVNAARQVSGVNKVVKIFQYIV